MANAVPASPGAPAQSIGPGAAHVQGPPRSDDRRDDPAEWDGASAWRHASHRAVGGCVADEVSDEASERSLRLEE